MTDVAIMNTFQPRLSPVALAVLLLSACGGGGGGGDSMVSTSPEPYVEIPGFVDKESIRPNVVPASTKSIQTVFQGQVKFAQSHTIDPEGNAASRVSYYAIDGANRTATQVWQFDHPSRVYAGYCSSAYMTSDKSMLVLYSATARRFTGVDANKNVVFDYSFAGSDYCMESFNATPIDFGNLNFTR